MGWNETAEAKGHKLERSEFGLVVNEGDIHSGPTCELCGDWWCTSCTAAEDIDPCDGGAASRAADAEYEAEQVTRDAQFLAVASDLVWSELTVGQQERWCDVAKKARAALAALEESK